jgi:hypothetical protein
MDRGGIAAVACDGLAISTVTLGRNEVRAGATPKTELIKTRRKAADVVGTSWFIQS